MLLGKRREREVEWEGEQQEINWVWLIQSARREVRRKDRGAMFFWAWFSCYMDKRCLQVAMSRPAFRRKLN